MKNKIKILDDNTINKIAAGEVVERPSSIVKELIENSIDADSTSITIEIKEGGKSYIRVTDNGNGINPEDIQLAFLRHSTSKISNPEDLSRILSLGFRGEALASISAVSMVELITKTEENLITLFTDKELNQAIDFAKLTVELIEVEILEKVKIGISSSKKALEMKTTYQQSVESINIAEGFKLPHNIHPYDELLLYRILSKISVDDMNDIVAEVYNYGIKSLDEEDIRTGIVFLSCDLNISEAARNLYIHRNTLIYRLDKIQKNTSLDLRNFEDATKFRVLLILNNYLVFNK